MDANANSKTADVFVLKKNNGDLYSPAVQASALAKYSRSPLPMRKLVSTFTEEDARAFQEKWGVTYGHSSVAELAHLPFCFEGVSIVASKFLERVQRAGYAEKSTRYQEFSASSFVKPYGFPDNLMPVVENLYETYHRLTPRVEAYVRKVLGKTDVGKETLTEKSVVKARVFDAVRYLLPAGTGTNLAAVLNTRDARYLMNDLLGHPLSEFRDLGMKMLNAAQEVAPVFAMGVKANEWAIQEQKGPRPIDLLSKPGTRLLHFDSGVNVTSDGFVQSLFWQEARRYGIHNDAELDAYMERRGKQPVPHFFRLLRMAFEIIVDYGAFRDIQRHRRCEQFVEPLTPYYGFAVPDDIIEAGCESEYRETMIGAGQAVWSSDQDPLVLQYGLPLGYNHRSLLVADLQEVYYIVELRTQPQGHISYRRAIYQMFEEAQRATSLMRWCRVIRPDSIGAHT